MKRPHCRSSRALCLVAVGIVTLTSAHADTQSDRRTGDALSIALPLVTWSAEYLRGERDGAWQFATALVASTATTEVLKRVTHVRRPDLSDDHSFPSEASTLAFSSATYVHRRYGIEAAWPLYVAATYVGYTRVHAREHRWGDIAAGAAVAAGMSWWLVEPRAARTITAVPAIGRGRVGLVVQATW